MIIYLIEILYNMHSRGLEFKGDLMSTFLAEFLINLFSIK